MMMAGLMAISALPAGAGAQSYERDDQRSIRDQQRDQDQQREQDSQYGQRDEGGRYEQRAQRDDRGRRNGDARWQGDRDGQWDPSSSYQDGRYSERRMSANDRVYRGSDGRYYCKRSNGTTGLVLGAVGGGLVGNALGGGTVGTLLGAGGGALLGKSIDQNRQNRNYRCR